MMRSAAFVLIALALSPGWTFAAGLVLIGEYITPASVSASSTFSPVQDAKNLLSDTGLGVDGKHDHDVSNP
jgi:hypothetical protein